MEIQVPLINLEVFLYVVYINKLQAALNSASFELGTTCHFWSIFFAKRGQKIHKNITRDISITIKTISISLSSLQQHTTDEKEKRAPVVALSWSLFAPLYIVFSLCVFFLVHFWSLKKDRAFVVNIFPFQR